MLLCSIFFLTGLSFTSAISTFSKIFPPCNSNRNADLSYYNRSKREDKLKYTSVCSELDSTEETPFVAMIVSRDRGRLLCMGSIIDEYHVLTAKRCFERGDASAIMVVAGYQSPYWGRNSQVKYVEKVVNNEQELAILILKKPFYLSDTVQPIRLIGPDKIITSFNDAYAVQYKTFGIFGIQVPKYLQQGDLFPKMAAYYEGKEPFLEKGDCDQGLGAEQGAITVTDDNKFMFCTIGKSEFCWTAQGSPTVVTMEKQKVQIGVLIYGKCKTNRPAAPSGGGGPPPPSGGGQPPSGFRFRRQGNQPVQDKDKYAPNVHIRIDKLHKWIKANSHIGVK